MRKPCPHKKVVSLHREKTNPRIERGHNQDLVTLDDLVFFCDHLRKVRFILALHVTDHLF